jgi:hypothetical protein
VRGFPAHVEEKPSATENKLCTGAAQATRRELPKKENDIMKLTKTLRMFGIAAGLIGTMATQSFALPANEIETTYYADASLTDEVGYSFLACDGSRARTGKTSSYKVTTKRACHSAPPAPAGQGPLGMCYTELKNLTSSCCTFISGECPNFEGIVITEIGPQK